MRALVGSNPGRLAICAISELLLVEAPSWAVALLVTPRSVPVPLPPPLSDCCTLTAGDSGDDFAVNVRPPPSQSSAGPACTSSSSLSSCSTSLM
uniref:Putative secreted protein n=1 Tax=Anopheles darlingi TaxID=43151 RepID=A0A2M4DG77_ANODA